LIKHRKSTGQLRDWNIYISTYISTLQSCSHWLRSHHKTSGRNGRIWHTVCNCCWVVCGGGICFLLMGTWFWMGQNLPGEGIFFGWERNWWESGILFTIINTKGAKSRNRTLNNPPSFLMARSALNIKILINAKNCA